MNYKELTKEKILNNETSKFNMVPNLLPMEILITEKPSSLITALANILDIKPEYINADSFRKWRLRTIERQASSTPKVRKNRFNQSEESIEDAKYHDEIIDDFIPLTAEEARRSEQEDEESFIKAVKPPRQKD